MEELIDLQTVQQPKSDDEIALPEGATSLTLLQQVYRNPSLPLPTRMRAAGMALPHEHPKLAVAVTVNAGDFADQLERAVERSRMIEAKPNVSSKNGSNENDASATASDLTMKPTIVDRRFRRW